MTMAECPPINHLLLNNFAVSNQVQCRKIVIGEEAEERLQRTVKCPAFKKISDR